jgi:hypothetical protein
MIPRGRASTWWLLAAIVVFTLVGAWFARNEDSGRDDILEPPTIDARDAHAVSPLATPEPGDRAAATRTAPTTSKVAGTAATPAPTVPLSAITGRIVDARGHPLADWDVRVIDSTDSPSNQKDAALADLKQHVSSKTDPEGSFRLAGLPEGAYILNVRSRRTPGEFESGWVRTGADEVHIVVPLDVAISKVEGRVVDREGRALPHVRVTRRESGDPTNIVSLEQPRAVWTSDDGSFEFEELGVPGTELSVSDSLVATTTFQLGKLDLRSPLVLQVTRACRVRFEGALVGERRFLSALDAAGSALTFEEFPKERPTDSKAAHIGGWMRTFSPGSTRMELDADPTAEYKLSEDTTTLELCDEAGNVVKRRTVHLLADQLNVVTW